MGAEDVVAFVLVLVRVGSMLAFLPLLGGMVVPSVVKALLAMAVSAVLFPVARIESVPTHWLGIVLTAAGEVTFGAAMGFSARVLFKTLRYAGEMIGRQMGMALSQASDPTHGVKATVVGNFCDAVAILLIFAIGAHRWLLAGIHESLVHWPVGKLMSGGFLRTLSVSAVGRAFSVAFQIAAPLLVLTFIISLLMALMARLVPEINILIVGFPLRIGVSLAALMFFTPVLVDCGAKACRMAMQFFTAFRSVS